MKKVTIQDIADALGISRNTVSKAINNSEGLAEATRQRILQKAVEMGYKQFSYVQAIAAVSADARKEKVSPSFQGEIALLTTTFLSQSHFASTMLDKFHLEISQLGYSMSIHRITPEDLRERRLPLSFQAGRVCAVMCIEVFDMDYADMICSLDLPVLFVDGPVKRFGTPIRADQLYMENTGELTRLLYAALQKGYRRVGFIGNYDHCQSFFERYRSFRDAMLMAEVPVEKRFILRENDPERLSQALGALEELPDLFVCANDFVAFDTLRALQARGWRVPEDVMLCGFDDCAESRSCQPPLTTVHIHTQVMAFTAAQMLLSRMKEPGLDYRIVHTQTDLIERESTWREGTLL